MQKTQQSNVRMGGVLLCLLLLSACGGGGGGETTPTTPTEHSVTISAATGAEQNSLACEQSTVDAECGLRLYQVMVESFIDGDSAHNYNVGYGSSHHKGDLQGIINSLDYIKSTGANAIWLTPVFASTPKTGQDGWTDKLDATGYYASDYFNVDPKFGTNAKFKELVDAAHQKGLYVFMDGVFGHFKDNIVASPMGRLPALTNTCVGSSGTFTAGTHQKCADYGNPASAAFFTEVATHWITEYKIDGWRLDQAYQVPTATWAAIRNSVQTASQNVSYLNQNGSTVKPLGHMVAEVWSGESQIASQAYGPAANPALLSAFDFPGRYRVVQALAVEESGAGKQPASRLADLYTTHTAYPSHAKPNLMLTNHDLVRFGDLLQRGNIAQPSDAGYWLRHKLAFAFMAAYSGPITLYYGDEIGQEVPNFAAKVSTDCAIQGLCDDHVSRDSGKVSGLNANQQNLKAYVAQLWALRDSNPALAYGVQQVLWADSNVFVLRKQAGSNRVVLLMNTQNTPAAITLNTSVLGSPASLTDLQNGDVNLAQDDAFKVSLPALTARLYRY